MRMLLAVLCLEICSAALGEQAGAQKPASADDYVVIGWNDLGMHCINPSYKTLGLLPPNNNLWVQVIRRGEPPQIVTTGISLRYSIANNTTVQGKTDFWQYALQLFGVNLPPGIGLTGNGLSGSLQPVVDHFEATGIPVLPYDDQMNWNPFQIAIVTLQDNPGKGNKKGQTVPVVLPVSDEINCAQCHAQGGDGTMNVNGGTPDVDANILMVHDYYHGPRGISSSRTQRNLVDMKPVLCAACHADNALGAKGNGTAQPLSVAMHGWHNPNRAPDATCYSCHPGATTQCLRTSIQGMGYMGATPSCQTGLCHGGIEGMADPARTPWVTEPNCEQCHGTNYSTGGTLYRRAKGHGGVFCAACHNSPHAWWPSKLWADNQQPVKLQGNPYPIRDCKVCHTGKQAGDNPHAALY